MFTKIERKPFEHLIKLVFIEVLCLFISTSSYSNTKNEESAKNENESASKELVRKPREQKNFDEWLDLSSKLEKFLTRVKAKKQAISDLVNEKNKEKDPDQLAKITKSLGHIHKEYVEMVGEYEKLRNFILYRFPERANEQKRVYKKIDSESLEDIETKGGIEGQLISVTRKLKKQYPLDKKRGPDKINENKSLSEKSVDVHEPNQRDGGSSDRSGITGTVILSQ